jgi:hypothetical protein
MHGKTKRVNLADMSYFQFFYRISLSTQQYETTDIFMTICATWEGIREAQKASTTPAHTHWEG